MEGQSSAVCVQQALVVEGGVAWAAVSVAQAAGLAAGVAPWQRARPGVKPMTTVSILWTPASGPRISCGTPTWCASFMPSMWQQDNCGGAKGGHALLSQPV